MSRSISQIIDELKAERFDERLVHFQGSYRFDIEGSGSHLVVVDHGRVSTRAGGGPADCVITSGPDDFVRIIEGEQNLLTAFMQGRVGVQGDLAVAMVFHGLLPARAGEEGREARP